MAAGEGNEVRANDALNHTFENRAVGDSPLEPTLRGFLYDMPGLVGVFDGPEHMCVFMNREYADLVERADVLGQPARAILTTSQNSAIVDLFDRVYASGQSFMAREVSTPRRNDDGRGDRALLDFTVKPIRNDRDAVTGLMVYAVDVTEQVRVRERLERLAAEQAAVLMYMADGVIILDPRETVTFANEVAGTLLGFDPRGLTLGAMLQSAHAVSSGTNIVLPSPETVNLPIASGTRVDWRIRGHEGVERFVQATIARIGSGRQAVGTVLVLRDTTAQHLMEEQKTAFLSSVAHDLRTPLTTIMGRVQRLLRRANRVDLIASDELRDELGRIDVTARRLATLIDELLEVANVSLGQGMHLRRAPVDLVALVREALDDVRQTTPQYTFTLDLALPTLTGQWDGARLRRVLSNLLSNAIKYSPPGSVIAVQVAQDHVRGDAILTVRDQGVGIPGDDLPRIFERFQRGQNVSRVQGTGIGLTTVSTVVQQHGGTISVESTEGEGTSFEIRLPTNSGRETAVDGPDEKPPQAQGE